MQEDEVVENEPLTKQYFKAWCESEFKPHTVAEEIYEKKVDKLWWIAVTGVSAGAMLMSLFLWILLQKDAALVLLQSETHRIAVSQAQVIETLKYAQIELARQGETQQQITTTMIDLIRQQNRLHGYINGNGKGGK